MSRQIFQLDEGKIQYLQDFLNHPTGKEILSIIFKECQSIPPIPTSGVSYAEMATYEAGRVYGWQAALSSFESLARKPIENDHPQEAAHQFALHKLASSGVYSREEIEQSIQNKP